MFFWIYDYPDWLMALVFMFAFTAFGVGGLLLFRLTALDWLHRDSRANDMVGFAMSSFAMLYGILLGLMAVDASQNLSDMMTIVDREAASVGALYRDVGGYPAPLGGELKGILRVYTRDIIDNAWPMQREGITQQRTTVELDTFFKRIQTFKPADAGETVIHQEALRQANNLLELRRLRLASVNTGIQGLLWAVVLFGAAINIGLVWMLRMSRHVHVVLVGLLAAFIGVVIFLIAAMDYPFRGDISVSSDAFEEVYQSMMAPDAKAAGTKF
ncbi:DUF4239 domain-containing protein [Polymorphobacter arshaanensis]|uniref:DUF4239 domain-containing protein n=1 Tax=Glacieibacterium arshaanense TaxID=2511025 RepID=A0A4Y9EQW3_9SPHN|nr:DUF4239 domain-containing protein [Polymorphobacter arshaanensis]TFU05603.1 DUF4239 domain-containing protein [Polymorphobacter arshaanensis]